MELDAKTVAIIVGAIAAAVTILGKIADKLLDVRVSDARCVHDAPSPVVAVGQRLNPPPLLVPGQPVVPLPCDDVPGIAPDDTGHGPVHLAREVYPDDVIPGRARLLELPGYARLDATEDGRPVVLDFDVVKGGEDVGRQCPPRPLDGLGRDVGRL